MSKLALLGGTPFGAPKVPTAKDWPIFDDTELNAVAEVVRSRKWGTGGPKQVEFEEKFAEFMGAKHAVVMTNGTHTLKLSLEALGIGPGDEVIVPGSTWQATASSVLDVNAVPVLCDVREDNWTIDPAAAEKLITPRTKAIIPVHLYGRMCDMDALAALARKYDLKIIEDCAHQHGSEWKGVKVGNIGEVGSFSLQCSKILQTGEGGMCITNDDDLYERVYSLKFCGRPRDPKAAVPTPTMQSGNFRGNEFAAAVGICQLARLDAQNRIREANAFYFEDMMQSEIPGITYLARDPRVTMQAMYRVSLRYDQSAWDGVSRNTVFAAYKAETEGAFKPVKPYEPLDNSDLYRPFSKKTHKLSAEYCRAIDPARFALPVVNRVFREEYLGFDHYHFLGERSELDKMVEIMKKLYENRGELLAYQAEMSSK